MSPDQIKKIQNDRLSAHTKEGIVELFDEALNERTSDERVKEIANEIKGCLGFITLPIASEHFYRARYWADQKQFPKNVSELLQPPPQFTGLGRCNLEKRPALYVSDHPLALPLECRLDPGAIFALIQFDRTIQTEDLSCLPLGIDPYLKFGNSPAMANMEHFLKNFWGENYETYRFMESQLHRAFVFEGDSDGIVYRFTAQICDQYFSACQELDAIYYPSIASIGEYHNLVIRPDRYSKTYTARKVALFEVLDINSIRQIHSASIDGNQNLEWNNHVVIDAPVPVGGRLINQNDPRVYIAPWRDTTRNSRR